MAVIILINLFISITTLTYSAKISFSMLEMTVSY